MHKVTYIKDWQQADGKPGHVEETYELIEHHQQVPFPFGKMFTVEGWDALIGSDSIHIKLNHLGATYYLFTKHKDQP
jgi:hypothetical protein